MLSEHCALRQLEKVTSTASKGDLAFVTHRVLKSNTHCVGVCGLNLG